MVFGPERVFCTIMAGPGYSALGPGWEGLTRYIEIRGRVRN